MSYDLMVFDPETPPRTREGFMEWYEEFTELEEVADSNDPTNTTEALQAWFHDLRSEFPAMNGPYAVGDDLIDDPKVSDYDFGKKGIYVAFSWSVAEDARDVVLKKALKHSVGFFDVSADEGTIDFSDGTIIKEAGDGIPPKQKYDQIVTQIKDQGIDFKEGEDLKALPRKGSFWGRLFGKN